MCVEGLGRDGYEVGKTRDGVEAHYRVCIFREHGNYGGAKDLEVR